MMIDDLPLGKALGARGSDIVRVQDFQHVGAGVAHERADADDDQRKDRQEEVLAHVEDLPGAGQIVVVSSDQTVEVEPAELDREEQLQQRCEEEGRKGNAGQRHDCDDVVGAAVLFSRRDDAERDRDDQLEEEGDGSHVEGDPDDALEFLNNRNRIIPAVAELAADRSCAPP